MLKSRIEEDLKMAQKTGDSRRRDTLRLLLSVIGNEEIEVRAKKKEELGEDDFVRILQKEAKKRKESIAAYRTGKREDLAEKEEVELAIIGEYLPARMPESELKKIVEETIRAIQPESPKEFGKVMAEAMRKVAGRVDGGVVKAMVEEHMKKEK